MEKTEYGVVVLAEGLIESIGEKALIDLVATMGYYDTVAMTLITAKAVAPKEDDVPQLAALPR